MKKKISFHDLKSQGKLPNFVIIGAPRAGTTSLHAYLMQHPQIFLPLRKELHFFAYPELSQRKRGPGDRDMIETLCKSPEEYAGFYRNVKKEFAIGEVSPSYLFFPNVADRIAKELGEVKIIVTLRNPMEKAFSQYCHMVWEGRETLPFEKALSEEKHREEEGWADIWLYRQSSLYSSKLGKYFHVFGKTNVKVILFNDLKKNPQKILREIFQFLKIEEDFKCDTSVVHGRSALPRSKFLSRLLMESNPLIPFARKIVSPSLGVPFRRFIENLNKGVSPEMDPGIREDLRLFFSQDIARLESLLNKKMHWN